MLAMEQILCELNGEELTEQGLPPGFRFHPTDEELITFYLASKVFKGSFCGVEIVEVDLNRCEPWELPDVAKMGEREWYLYSVRDRKYPTGLRTNRATGAGYWKATGKDREVYSALNGTLVGMKKTLVFYKGRAPRGEKTKWVMHEYRLDGHFSYRHACKEEWVICRVFHKNGEKKNAIMFGSEGYDLVESARCTYNSLPPLLETSPATVVECRASFQNPFDQILHQAVENENELKRLMNWVVPQSQSQSQSCYYNSHSINPIWNGITSPSILLPHQDSIVLKQQQQQLRAAEACRFTTHLEMEPSNLMDIKMEPNPPACNHQHPLFFEMECTSTSTPSVPAEASVHHIYQLQSPLNGTQG